MNDLASDRIKRLRKRFLKDVPVISIERAKLYTEKWQETEGQCLSLNIRVALAMKNVYQNMNYYIDPEDRIIGTWTENFLGIPIDIERGLYNNVFKYELDKGRMKRHSIKNNFKFALWKIKKDGIGGLIHDLKNTKNMGYAMPTMGSTTLDKRKINPYQINPRNKNILLKQLLPYWEGKTIADYLEKAFLEADIYEGEFGDMIKNLPRGTARNDVVYAPGAAIGVWQGHLIIDHETPIKEGLLAMYSKVDKMISNDTSLKQEELDFLTSLKNVFEGIIIYAENLAKKLKSKVDAEEDPSLKKIFTEIYEICKKVPLNPAKSFKEAVQSYWTVKTAVELALPYNVHAPGRLDQIFYPYYKKDILENKITEEDARELLEELFLKIMSHNMRPYSNVSSDFSQRYEGSEPVTLGGLNRLGEDATNDLTYVMLDAADRSKASLNFAVRIHDKTPEKLLMKIADLHYNGVSSISVMNDNISIKALLKRGFTKEDAFEYGITGCVDMCAPGKMGGEGFSSILLCRTMDLALRNGDSMTIMGLMRNSSIKTGDPNSFKSFDEFLNAFLSQAKYMIKKIVDGANIRDKLYDKYLPAPFISAFMNCLDSKKDITKGGALYNAEGILFMTSIANTVDSLYVIKKLIFEQKMFTFKELLEAIDSNYSNGSNRIHKLIMDVKGKWGNGNPESDKIANRITTELFEETYKYKTYKGGFVAPFINSMTTHTYDGRIFGATPDGRLAGKPFAASCNPYNVEENGPTGVLRSVAALNYEHVLGCAVNIRMHPSGIGQNQEVRKKWIALIKTYFKLGGEQLQPTVVSTEVLKAAQSDPENYQNVIVKVGGYSAYFVDLGKEVQNEIISRTEHTMV